MNLSMVLGGEGAYIVCVTAGFFGKKFPSGKNDQKWSKMAQKHVFWTF